MTEPVSENLIMWNAILSRPYWESIYYTYLLRKYILYLQNQTIEFKCKYQVCLKSQVVIKIWSMNFGINIKIYESFFKVSFLPCYDRNLY